MELRVLNRGELNFYVRSTLPPGLRKKLFSNFDIKSTGHFTTASTISRFRFDFQEPLNKTCFEKASSLKVSDPRTTESHWLTKPLVLKLTYNRERRDKTKTKTSSAAPPVKLTTFSGSSSVLLVVKLT